MKVSICIPQYNRTVELRQVLEDILSQTYADFELLIVDDASTQDTQAVLKEFDDSRIRYFRNPQNLGLYPNFNRCVELASGDYIAIYHNHDRYDRTIVEKSVKILDEYPQVGFVHTGTVSRPTGNFPGRYYVRNWPEIMDGADLLPHLIQRWDSPVHQPTVMARKVMYLRAGKYDDQVYGACADTPIWMKMCSYGKVGYIAEPLMQITPRTAKDRYGTFDWKDVQGMARAHWLGFDILYGNLPARLYRRKRISQQYLHDRHFLLWLAYVIVEGNQPLVQQAKNIFDIECSLSAQITANAFIQISPFIFPVLRVGRKFYRRYVFMKDQRESNAGQEKVKGQTR